MKNIEKTTKMPYFRAFQRNKKNKVSHGRNIKAINVAWKKQILNIVLLTLSCLIVNIVLLIVNLKEKFVRFSNKT